MVRDTNSAVRAESGGYDKTDEGPPTPSLGYYSQGNRRNITAEILAQVGFRQVRGTGFKGSKKRDESLEAYLQIPRRTPQ